MNPLPKTTDDDTQRLINEYLKKGGEITKCQEGERTEDIEYKGNFYTKRRKKKEDTEKDG